MLESDVAEETDEKEEEEHDIAGLGPGPVDYAESVEWARVQQKALQQFDSVNGTELYPRLCERMAKGIVLTSHYSGHGTPEIVAAEVARTCSGQPKVSLYSACDICPKARKMLAVHDSSSRPQHIFNDILDKLEPAKRDQLWAAFRVVEAELEREMTRLAVNALSHAEYCKSKQAVIDKLGNKFVSRACALLKNARFNDMAWCDQCTSYCPVCPERSDSQTWLEVAGIICVAFSKMGVQKKWIDESAVVALVWAHWVLQTMPDMVIAECVASWEYGPIAQLFDPVYSMVQHVFCPTDLGHPVRRRRIYMTWLRRCKFSIPAGLAEGIDKRFSDLFGKRIVADGGMYLLASREQVAALLQRVAARNKGLDLTLEEALKVDPLALLEPGTAARVRQYREQALSLDPVPLHLFINAAQTLEHFGMAASSKGIIPTLMRGSFILDIGGGAGDDSNNSGALRLPRLVHPWECYAAMGFRMPFSSGSSSCSSCSSSSTFHCPFEGLPSLGGDGAVDLKDLRVLIGNGMHCAAVGAWLQFSLSIVHDVGRTIPLEPCRHVSTTVAPAQLEQHEGSHSPLAVPARSKAQPRCERPGGRSQFAPSACAGVSIEQRPILPALCVPR